MKVENVNSNDWDEMRKNVRGKWGAIIKQAKNEPLAISFKDDKKKKTAYIGLSNARKKLNMKNDVGIVQKENVIYVGPLGINAETSVPAPDLPNPTPDTLSAKKKSRK